MGRGSLQLRHETAACIHSDIQIPAKVPPCGHSGRVHFRFPCLPRILVAARSARKVASTRVPFDRRSPCAAVWFFSWVREATPGSRATSRWSLRRITLSSGTRPPAFGLAFQQCLFHQGVAHIMGDQKYMQPQQEGQSAGLAALPPLNVEGPELGCQGVPGHVLVQCDEKFPTAVQLPSLVVFMVRVAGFLQHGLLANMSGDTQLPYTEPSPMQILQNTILKLCNQE